MKTNKIPFELERWQNGDFVRVETREGNTVEQLHLFNVDYRYRLYGIIGDSIIRCTEEGLYSATTVGHRHDLFLIIEYKEAEQDDECVWKYVLKNYTTGVITILYYKNKKQTFPNSEIIKKEKVKISEL